MKYYGFEYQSGRSTTSGSPNEATGHFNIAGGLALFATKKSRDEWAENGDTTSDMRGNCREAITSKESRSLHLGMSMNDYNDMLECIDCE